jgi:PBP1b-binding outer membrane lipoprotein LpoB
MKLANMKAMIVRCLLALGMVVLAGGCSSDPAPEGKQAPPTTEDSMNSANSTAVAAPIPPIDAAASAVYETASFRLG